MSFTNDYFYGNEAEQFTFYRLPKALFTNSRYKDLSDGAKILYGLMLDRMGLSTKNDWRDKENRIYIYFTLEDIQEYMNCGHTKGVKLLAELDSPEINLIERVKRGQGKPTRIYVKKFILNEVIDNSNQKSKEHAIEEHICGSQDFCNDEVQTSANEKSRLPQTRGQDFSFADTNYIDFIKNDFNDTEINSKSKSCPVLENKIDDIDDDIEAKQFNNTSLKDFSAIDVEQLENRIKEQINYEWLITRSFTDADEINSFVFIILDALLSNSPTVRVNGEDKPQAIVKSMLSKITSGEVLYAINKFKEQKHEIKHKKSYLLTCLYNAQIEGVYNGINYLNTIGGQENE